MVDALRLSTLLLYSGAAVNLFTRKYSDNKKSHSPAGAVPQHIKAQKNELTHPFHFVFAGLGAATRFSSAMVNHSSSRSSSAEVVKRMRSFKQRPCEFSIAGDLVASSWQNQFLSCDHFLHRSSLWQYLGAGCRVSQS